jgi:mannose-1-phosphate guanylyltransferase / mannose-6-phosphate isomerase
MAKTPSGRITPVILSGGSGSRLWPLSRAMHPKQMLDLVGEHSLIQETALRLNDPELFGPPIIVCNEEHRFVIAEQLREVGITPAAIILEPMARNTAPAIAVAAVVAGPDNIILSVPSDGHIGEAARYRDSVRAGLPAARDERVVTFGVAPSRPETGFGYIEEGDALEEAPAHRVAAFHEKPDAARAETYLQSGKHLWNTSLFLVRAGFFLDELDRLTPGIVPAARKAVALGQQDLDFTRLDADAFAAAPSISVDHALMEKTGRAAVLRLETSWSDVGSWQELWQQGEGDADGNVLVGDVIAEDSSGNYLRSEGRLIAALGLRDQIVVATRDVVMILPRERSQDVKLLVERVAAAGREEHNLHPLVHRPWGTYEGIDEGDGYQVKRIVVKPGGRLSLQRHRHRAEHWIVVTGVARVTIDEKVFELRSNESTHVPLGAVHRLENPGSEPLYMIEVQCGDYLGEDDIERLEDVYNRA